MIPDLKKVILIDDDPIQNHLNSLSLRNFFIRDKKEIISFTDPVESLPYLSQICDEGKPVVLLLDLNMPVLTGWDVLEALQALGEDKPKNLIIYILSSSIDPEDMQRAAVHPLVKGFISKPLARQISAIFTKLHTEFNAIAKTTL